MIIKMIKKMIKIMMMVAFQDSSSAVADVPAVVELILTLTMIR